jgi:tetratricopeptide (TPR) repeat protein
MVYQNNAYYREAIDDYSEVLEDDPEGTNKLWALPSRGLCYLILDEHQNAINDYTKYIEMSEDFNEYVYTQRASAYSHLGKYDEAINDYSMVIKNSDEDDLIANAYFQRGWIKEYLKNDRGALQDYNRSIELDSTNSAAYRQRGTLYLRLKYPEKAKEDFEHILNIDTLVLGSSRRHYALYYLGDTVDAIDWTKKILDFEPEEAGNYYDVACLFALMGNGQKSIEFLQRAFELGYRDIIHVKRDSDLDSIRELPEYKALIEKYEAETSTQQIEELLKQERNKMSDKDKLDLLREFNY